uniref:hypothetical protein n=1 Tax=Streptomyces niveiscabiei TaxID=164115 RepID=UPI0038F660EC
LKLFASQQSSLTFQYCRVLGAENLYDAFSEPAPQPERVSFLLSSIKIQAYLGSIALRFHTGVARMTGNMFEGQSRKYSTSYLHPVFA